MKAQFEDNLALTSRGDSVAGAGPLEKEDGEVIKYFVAWVTQGSDCIAEGIHVGDLVPQPRNGKPAWELQLGVRESKRMQTGPAYGSAVIVFQEDEGLFTYTWTYPVQLV